MDGSEQHSPSADTLNEFLKPDWDLLDRYQAFSAELLRSALLGIAGIGFLLTQLTRKDSSLTVSVTSRPTMWLVFAALTCLGVSAGAALGHRYVSSDSMAYYISLLRMRRRHAPPKEVAEEKACRDRRFKLSAHLLIV